MEKAIEFNIKNNELKKYLEECLTEENIDYEIKIEDKWLQKYEEASQYYQVYCLYVNSNNLEKIERFMEDFKNGSIITEGIEEFSNIDEKENDDRFKIFTFKNFLKYYWIAIIIMGILIIIGARFAS